MTAWDRLVLNSFAADGSSAWVHLNSPKSTDVNEVTAITVAGTLTSSVTTNLTSSIDLVLSSSIQQSSLSSNLDSDITTGITE